MRPAARLPARWPLRAPAAAAHVDPPPRLDPGTPRLVAGPQPLQTAAAARSSVNLASVVVTAPLLCGKNPQANWGARRGAAPPRRPQITAGARKRSPVSQDPEPPPPAPRRAPRLLGSRGARRAPRAAHPCYAHSSTAWPRAPAAAGSPRGAPGPCSPPGPSVRAVTRPQGCLPGLQRRARAVGARTLRGAECRPARPCACTVHAAPASNKYKTRHFGHPPPPFRHTPVSWRARPPDHPCVCVTCGGRAAWRENPPVWASSNSCPVRHRRGCVRAHPSPRSPPSPRAPAPAPAHPERPLSHPSSSQAAPLRHRRRETKRLCHAARRAALPRPQHPAPTFRARSRTRRAWTWTPQCGAGPYTARAPACPAATSSTRPLKISPRALSKRRRVTHTAA